VGNGNAGVNAAAAIRERNASASITLLSEEPYLGYNRPQLTKQMLGDLEESIPKIKDAQWYHTHNIHTMTGVKVTNVDSTTQKITLDSGATLAYDELILATGARCFMPPVENSTLQNVVSIRTLQDVKRVRELLPTIQDVIVIGGGVLGLEVAWEMKKANKHVTVLEVMPNLMPRQLDWEASTRLEEIVRNQNIDIHTNVKVCKIVGSDKVEGVQLEGDVVIPGQLVIFSAGVKANTELAVQAGCAVERAIVVNSKMETSVPHIYACGDCAQFEGMNYAIWPEAGEQGRIAGANAAGDEVHYLATNPAITTNCMSTSLYARGDVGKGNGKYRTLELMDTARKTYEKYYFLNSQLVGVILLGDTSKIAMVDEALNAKKRFDQIFKF
ncbi:MAG: NAD(P)/FAD-dependent oxidoreductase, partial [Erysipelotrichaceae bacterium]